MIFHLRVIDLSYWNFLYAMKRGEKNHGRVPTRSVTRFVYCNSHPPRIFRIRILQIVDAMHGILAVNARIAGCVVIVQAGAARIDSYRLVSARLDSVHFSQLADRALPRCWRARCTIHYGVQPRSKRPSATRARAGVSPPRVIRFCFDRGHRGCNREQFTTTTITTTTTTTTIASTTDSPCSVYYLSLPYYYLLPLLLLLLLLLLPLLLVLLLLRWRALPIATRSVYAHYHTAAVCRK